MTRTWIALLGQRDFPTDGVADYCEWLASALAPRSVTLNLVQVPWGKLGWGRAIAWLWQESRQWQGRWVWVQYTAFGWSGRGFPLGFLVVLWVLRQRGVRLGVIFHDTQGFPGQRWIDRLRRTCQESIMKIAYRWAERSVMTIEFSRIPWLPADLSRATLIPVGSNIPEPDQIQIRQDRDWGRTKTIAIFGVTGGRNTVPEVENITAAVRQVAQQTPVRLVVMGRGSAEAASLFTAALADTAVELVVLGLLEPERVAQELAIADTLLFVRGNISSGRTSAIAGLAAGLPIVGYFGPHTGFPLTEAGVLLVERDDRVALADALTRVLTEPQLWLDLHQRSLQAYQTYFTWGAIATQFCETCHD